MKVGRFMFFGTPETSKEFFTCLEALIRERVPYPVGLKFEMIDRYIKQERNKMFMENEELKKKYLKPGTNELLDESKSEEVDAAFREILSKKFDVPITPFYPKDLEGVHLSALAIRLVIKPFSVGIAVVPDPEPATPLQEA